MPTSPHLLPTVTSLDRPFWEAARRHELRVQRCTACERLRYPASPVCPECGHAGSEWALMSGRGRILSWVVFHQSYFPALADQVPYNVAVVTLDEGVNLIGNVLAPNDALHRDMAVEVAFADVTPEISVPQFRTA